MNRLITPGDKICNANEIKTSQLGIFQQFNAYATVNVHGTDVMIHDINFQDLIPLKVCI